MHEPTTANEPRIGVRPRTDADLEACERVAREVHLLDGYPPYLPNGDYRWLLTKPEAIAAFVAIDRDDLVGHVALHPPFLGPATKLVTTTLGVEPAELGIVARLFVAPTCRGKGAGWLLLDTATTAARDRGLVPVLDVWTELRAAIALYDNAGWRRLGTVDARLPDGSTFPEYVYVA